MLEVDQRNCDFFIFDPRHLRDLRETYPFVGYADWVDAQVGVGLTNGLYKFVATFAEDPPECVNLTVGELSVAVTNAGDYAFLLEKGIDYHFGTSPRLDSVEWSAVDDLAGGEPAPASAFGWGNHAAWTVDGGWLDFLLLTDNSSGLVNWLPTLQGSPNVGHFGGDDFPMVLEAELLDCPPSLAPTFRWSSSDPNIQFMSPNDQSTTVKCASLPSWGSAIMSVRANFGSSSLVSYLYPTYGTDETPQVAFSMAAPEIVFLNDDNRTTRWYRVSVQLSCPVETNVTVSLTHSGLTGAKFASDPMGANCFSLTNIQLSVTSTQQISDYGFYFSCTNSALGSGTFDAICMMPDGGIRSQSKSYRVIEPLRKLVCTEPISNGYYNPSRLVYGTNAWLKVGARGQFSASEVQWRVVSGPGRIAATNNANWAVSIIPTSSSGEVVVEAAFGKDANIQPRFVLPIRG